MKKIYIVTGHYGCGKTNLSVNLAVRFSEKGFKTAIVDMDIVNPYFRTADFGVLFMEKNISFYSTMYANTNLDIPAISFDIEAIISRHERIVLDIGGDDAGAAVLGRYRDVFGKYSESVEMICVINRYRETGDDVRETALIMKEIGHAAGLNHTGIVNNSNIGKLTSSEDILESVGFAQRVSEISGIPLLCHTADRRLKCPRLDGLAEYIEVYVKNII
ncbi:MAG: P-loop NTPase [Porcipelethomonas sp.]